MYSHHIYSMKLSLESLWNAVFYLKKYLKVVVPYLRKCSLLNYNTLKSLLLLLGHNATHYKVAAKYCVSENHELPNMTDQLIWQRLWASVEKEFVKFYMFIQIVKHFTSLTPVISELWFGICKQNLSESLPEKSQSVFSYLSKFVLMYIVFLYFGFRFPPPSHSLSVPQFFDAFTPVSPFRKEMICK